MDVAWYIKGIKEDDGVLINNSTHRALIGQLAVDKEQAYINLWTSEIWFRGLEQLMLLH